MARWVLWCIRSGRKRFEGPCGASDARREGKFGRDGVAPWPTVVVVGPPVYDGEEAADEDA